MKLFIYNILFIHMCIGGYSYSQSNSINDSLLSNFKKEEVYNVFYDYYNKLARERIKTSFNFNEAYYDQELKFYLLKLLDENEYLKYRLGKYREEHEAIFLKGDPQFDKKKARLFIKQYLRKEITKTNNSIDSIFSSKKLYEEYVNLTLNWMIEERKKDINKLIPPNEILTFHRQIAYPEFYVKMKEWIIEYDINIINKEGAIDITYIQLVFMNDPEALEKLREIIDEFIKSKGTKYHPAQIIYLLEAMKSPFAIEQLIRMTNEDFNIELMSDGTSETIEANALYILGSTWNFVNKESNNKKEYLMLFEDSIFLREHKQDIINKGLELREKYRKEESYWMQNMPFTKKN